ncbi:MAG TPA: DUF1036 domain-containing protein [Rhizomicrobium sp.]|jgi:uncharacterized membrane protein
MRGRLAALMVLATGLGFAAPAQAALKLCNRTSYVLYAATAAVSDRGSSVKGWTRIAPGDCQTARPERLSAQSYLVYARSALAHSGPSRAWGGDFPLCVKDDDFVLNRKGNPPGCDGGAFAVPFATVETHNRPDWTMNLDEQPRLAGLLDAQLAGVKRLLKDNGYKIAAIDTKPDKATGTALADFRKKMKFADRDGNDKLFAALEKAAAERGGAPQGFTVCNDDRADIVAALAEPSGNDAISRGWWRIAGKACARMITTPLKGSSLWLLAQRPGGAATVSGPDQFCTANQEFEIKGRQGCAQRGFAQAGFARIATAGKTGIAVHVGANGLTAPAAESQTGISK